jgi:glycosyltransferase involved in cell wall biosynthesis
MPDLNPLVSIIIPVYNSENFLSEAIHSALAQTWNHTEIIVIDDGSSDNSFSIAKKFSSDSFKIYKQNNKGASAARNLGFAVSKGDYIQYLDADDILAPDKIEKQLQLLGAQTRNYISSCSWARFSTSINKAKLIPQKVWADLSPIDWLSTALSGGGMMQTACWLTPRHLIKKAGLWNESLKKNPNDDGEFFCRVLLNSDGIKFCKLSKVYYREHNNDKRVSKIVDREAIDSLFKSHVSYEREILKVEKSQKTINAVVAKHTSFIYVYYNDFPDLALKAENRIKNLGISKLKPQGGENFLILAKIIGFKKALRLRKVLLKNTKFTGLLKVFRKIKPNGLGDMPSEK